MGYPECLRELGSKLTPEVQSFQIRVVEFAMAFSFVRVVRSSHSLCR